MDVLDFVTREEFKKLKGLFEKRDCFKHEREIQFDGTVHKVSVSARRIDKNTADLIWDGHDYLCSFNYGYKGKKGIGGKGYATDKFDMFDSYESFITWLENSLSGEKEFEQAEIQLCLW